MAKRTHRLVATILAGAMLLATPWVASAAEPVADQDGENRSAPEEARGWEIKPSTTGSDALLFLPRALLFLPKMVLGAIFYPVRAGLEALDRHAVIEHTVDFFYNDARTAAVLPKLSFLTSFGLTAGANAFHHDLFGHGESLDASAKFGGLYEQAYELGFRDEHVAGTPLSLVTRLRYEVKPQIFFDGIGNGPSDPPMNMLLDPRATSATTRFAEERFLAIVSAGLTLGEKTKRISPSVSVIYNRRAFGEKRSGASEPSIETVYDTGQITGFGDRVDLVEIKAGLVLDFRNAQGFTASGTRLQLFAGGVPDVDGYSFWHYGAEATTYIDLYRGDRTLVLRAAIEGVSGNKDAIPFTDLPRLGGPHRLRGYRLDRFRDRLAAVGTIEYRYPVHKSVLGHLYIDAGKVARNSHELLRTDDIHFGYGGGLLFGSQDNITFNIDLSYGDGLVVFVTTEPLRAFKNKDRQL